LTTENTIEMWIRAGEKTTYALEQNSGEPVITLWKGDKHGMVGKTP
jgi:hypothetical protein